MEYLEGVPYLAKALNFLPFVLMLALPHLLRKWFGDTPPASVDADAATDVGKEWDAVLASVQAGAAWVNIPQNGGRIRISRAGLARVHRIVAMREPLASDALGAETPEIADKITAVVDAAKIVPSLAAIE